MSILSICLGFSNFVANGEEMRPGRRLLYLRWTITVTCLIFFCYQFSKGAVADLPSRLPIHNEDTPTVTPTFTPTVTPTESTPPPSVSATPVRSDGGVAKIVLELDSDIDYQLTSVVQWKDRDGYWHDVSHWYGDVIKGQTVWWVEAKDFATGPFRWIVYSKGTNREYGVSEEFNLPSFARTTLVINVPDSKKPIINKSANVEK